MTIPGTLTRRRWRAGLALLAVAVLAGVGSQPAAAAEVDASLAHHTRGFLPDGTEYGIQVPENWNGAVINDLDPVSRTGSELHEFLLHQGYALSGTRRHPGRELRYDPSQEIRNQARVLDIFEAEYGTPEHAIQFGCSGGGAVAMGMGETYPDKVDGVIPVGYQTGVVIGNMWLDLVFTLKALLAPDSDLPVVGIKKTEENQAGVAWSRAIDAAQQTREGEETVLGGAYATETEPELSLPRSEEPPS